MPLYAKSHSYGEYVFDWAWADAYHRHGLSYYPKLLGAIPFSPVTGPRLLARDGETRALLVRAALRLSLEVSSLHVLFPTEPEAREMEAAGMMLRRSVQFHWENRGYASFDEFLSDLASAKRKKIRQERRRVRETGVQVRRLTGGEIRDEHWSFFTRCYSNTYRAHHSTPYLNLEFFRRLGETLPEHLLMVLAELDGKPSYFLKEVKLDSQLNFWDLDSYIRDLQQSGFDVVRLRVQLHKKFSYPLITLVMAVLAVPFALSTGKKGAVAGVAVAVSIAVFYTVVSRLFEAMGDLSQLPPALAAWSPDLIFCLLGGYLILKVPT